MKKSLYLKIRKIKEILKDKKKYMLKKLFVIILKMKSQSMTRNMMKNKITRKMLKSFSLTDNIINKMLSDRIPLRKMRYLTR